MRRLTTHVAVNSDTRTSCSLQLMIELLTVDNGQPDLKISYKYKIIRME